MYGLAFQKMGTEMAEQAKLVGEMPFTATDSRWRLLGGHRWEGSAARSAGTMDESGRRDLWREAAFTSGGPGSEDSYPKAEP